MARCSPERLKKREYFAANMVWVLSLTSEEVQLHHGLKNKSKNMGELWPRPHSSHRIFVLHYSEETPHIPMANTRTEQHKLTGREQNGPLTWPFFFKLWPWSLEEKDKSKTRNYLIQFKRQLSSYGLEQWSQFPTFWKYFLWLERKS